MDLPDLVTSTLGPDESVAARVALGSEDVLFIADQRSLVYRAEGLLSDESVEEYPHDAERVTVSEGRRKSKITLDYGLDGERTLTIPADHLSDTLRYVLAGVLDVTGVLEGDEEVTRAFRFSELSLVITTRRVVKHIGAPVWDEDFETYHYEDVTDLTFEEGSVATSVVLTLGDRQERFKTPNEQARAVREGLETVLLAYHDVESLEELRVQQAPETDTEDADAVESDPFGGGPDPLGANPTDLPDEAVETADPDARNAARETNGHDRASAERAGASAETSAKPAETDAGRVETDTGRNGTGAGRRGADSISVGSGDAVGANSAGAGGGDAPAQSGSASDPGEAVQTNADEGFEGSGFEAAGPIDEDRLSDEVAALREAVERQNDQLQKQQQTIEKLIEELRRGR